MGNQRLSGVLDAETRARLGLALAGHVLSRVVSTSLAPVIVTSDPDVSTWAEAEGYTLVTDPGTGLSAAAAAGVRRVLETSARWLVLHSDLPLLDETDLLALEGPLRLGREVIAPSSDGGTTAIGGQREIEFRFGPASFHRHLSALHEPHVVARPRLLADLDSPADLAAVTTAPRGRWLTEFIPHSLGSPVTRNLY